MTLWATRRLALLYRNLSVLQVAVIWTTILHQFALEAATNHSCGKIEGSFQTNRRTGRCRHAEQPVYMQNFIYWHNLF